VTALPRRERLALIGRRDALGCLTAAGMRRPRRPPAGTLRTPQGDHGRHAYKQNAQVDDPAEHDQRRR
jgi:hypothetical protein